MAREIPVIAELERWGVEPLIWQVDAAAMRQLIILRLGWSRAKAKEFFAAPEHQPFTTGYEIPEDPAEAFRQFATIGRYLNQRGDKDQLRSFCQAAQDYLIAPQVIAIEDAYNGLDRRAVGRGEAFRPAAEVLKVFKKAAGSDSRLLQEMLSATEGGRIDTVFEVLFSRRLPEKLRRALETVYEVREADPRWSQTKLELTWQAEALRLSMGIGLDQWLELKRFGSAKEETVRLKELLAQWFVPQMRQALGPGSSFSFWQILEQRAETKAENLTLEEKERFIRELMAELFPEAQESAGRLLAFAGRPGTSSRAWNMAYFNQQGELVEVSLVNPRDPLSEAAAFAAHEVGGHTLHLAMLSQAGSPEKWLSLSASLKNTLANLVQEQVRRLVELRQGLSSANDWWPHFRWRYQIPFGLTQIAVRQELEKIWAGGHRGALTKEQIQEIESRVGPQIADWYRIGVPLKVPFATIARHLNPVNAVDGLVYLPRAGGNPIADAFSKKFGELWVDQPQARAVLRQVMTATAETEDLEELTKIVAES